ncbi:hypothetical protein BV20DRAFT_939368, partial [Pilatotrama ljubarskyi]
DITEIRQRLAFLCHDLRTFSTNEDAALRLNTSVHAHFLGPPYLSESHAEYVRTMTIGDLRHRTKDGARSETQTQRPGQPVVFNGGGRVKRLAKSERAAADGGGGERDFVMCTSHDLAPLLQEACGFPKQHFEMRMVRDAYKRWEKEVRKANKTGKARKGQA